MQQYVKCCDRGFLDMTELTAQTLSPMFYQHDVTVMNDAYFNDKTHSKNIKLGVDFTKSL